MKKIVTLSLLSWSQQLYAADSQVQTYFFGGVKTIEDLLMVCFLGVMIMVTFVIGLFAFNISKQINTLLKPKETLNEAYLQAMESRTFWQKIAGLKPLAMEKDIEMEHQYDGIAELDNPTPTWFMALFYSSIVAAVVYLVGYHVIGNGKIMTNEYTEEMAIAEKAHQVYMKKFANAVNENNVKALLDEKSLADGAKIYTQNCVACHGEKAEGKVGPNLTDEFWLHGGSPKDIFHTITEGVSEKGMISWKKSLNPIQIQHVLSYLIKLQGSNPPNPKEPQGDKYVMSK